MVEIVDAVNYLSIDDLITINRRLIEEQTPDEPISVLNPSNLASSQARPSMVKYYQQTDDMFVLAASLIESLIQNHPFANANKRTAMMAGAIFLLLNGYELTAPGEEIVEMAVGIACKEYSSEEVESWLYQWSRIYDAKNLCNQKTIAISTLVETTAVIFKP
ncbi:type II toxin-antitoxin system death-on-curing family toxin [Winslowiella toletana]|uniref:type II toxin-antitoxin system death-on-curing family toxin n=1 Tax=Winslowiella toletana TaxID=92490 RepID=UPI0028BE2FC1|nr:type II toxin-antitoxin system death-on-curing family toxin [Winslowiella toletana]WNN42781.1 type II toxin-antitoxin system death-on-curing family toxin [Winslowiella toletana]